MKTINSSVKISSSGFVLLIKSLCLLCLLLSRQPLLSANTLRVPEEYPSIQAAVDAAQEGDTVLVSPGVYYENIQLRGRNIVLTSRFALEKKAFLIEQTIVDGSQPLYPDTASCLLIWKGETAATVVEGFTFRNGRGTVWLDPAGAGTFREGGGILTEFSSPVLRNNIIRDNTVAAIGAGMVSNGGGGIRCGEGAPLIENNRIIHNRGDGYGGGVVLNYCPGAVVRNNVIAFNTGGKDFSGGGFWSTGQGQTTVVELKNNVIAYNQSLPGASQYAGKGGGVWTFSITLKARNNIVWGNTQPTGKQMNQAGAFVELRYNCIQDGAVSAGNISADPLFADTTCFTLSPGSPCIDTGDPDTQMQDHSRNGKSADFPARGQLRSDMGAFGGAGSGLLLCNPLWEANAVFTKVTNSPVVTTPGDSRSVNWIDIDGDQDQDLFISNGPKDGENNFLYRNDGKGKFTLVQGDPVVQDLMPSDGATWADLDNDGDIDGFVVNWYDRNNLLYKNNGNGTFQQILTGPATTDKGYSETASWGDYDQDGKLDLYVTNSEVPKRNFLYHNKGNGEFTKITTGAMVTDAFTSRCVNWVDYDNDGDPDLFVTNEADEDENLYQNNGNGQFVKITDGPLVHDGGKTMSASWGDYDNDGDFDVFLANDKGNDALFRNMGNGTFEKITTGPVVNSGGNSFGSAWGDIDNDGDLDLFVTNSFGGGQLQNFLFINTGNGTLTRDTADAPSFDTGWSYGSAFGDMDRDGDLDLAVANCYAGNQPDYLYENHASEGLNKWLMVNCIGTTSNHSAIGAKVLVHATIDGVPVVLLREISAQTGYCGQNQLPAHFGLGNAPSIEAVEVRWPSGLEEVYGNIFPNQYITLTEGSGVTLTREPGKSWLHLSLQPNPFSDTIQFNFDLEQPTRLRVEVADLNGRMLRQLANSPFDAGHHMLDWDGKMADGSPAPAGSYLLSLHSGKDKISRIFLKTGGGK